MENNAIIISVIVPVYNSELYLEVCLESLRKQTFRHYEVWMIDDGSTDGSARICDEFARKNTCFHVVHTHNQGVSAARNIGLDHSRGEWICFVDSDDVVNENYLLDLCKAISDESREDMLVVQGFNIVVGNEEPIVRVFEDRIYEEEDLCLVFRDLNLNRSGYPFAKLYNKKILREKQIRFIEQIHYAEDVIFMLSYICHVSAICTIGKANYYYYMRNGNSLSSRIFSFDSEYFCYEIYLELIRQIKEKFAIQEEDLKGVYSVISEYLIRRALAGLYQPSTRKPFGERITILKRMTEEQVSWASKYYTNCAWFHKVNLFLLAHRFYYFCDWFNCLIALGRAMKKYKI